MLLSNYFLILLFLGYISNCNCYVYVNKPTINLNKLNCQKKIEKWNAYKTLLRTTSCKPTFMLNFLGGWLTIPSYKIFLNRNFWLFSLITQLTMMNSMVINDLFDLKVDLINNSRRPLVNKQITIKEARCVYISFSIIITVLSIVFFKNNYFYLKILLLNFILFIYTPVLKKILLLKNITCASVVSSTILMTSKSILNNLNNLNSVITFNGSYNLQLVYILTRLLFISSMYIEFLLDIKDSEGDKENNIITFANFFGERKTVNCLLIVYTINLFQEGYNFYNLKKYKLLIGYLLSNLIFFKNLFILRYRKITNEKLLTAVNQTTLSLIIFLISIIFN